MKQQPIIQQFKSPLLFLSSSDNNNNNNAGSSSSSSLSSFWTALILLNAPIRNPPSILFEQLWSISQYRVCADGGANRLYQATTTSSSAESILQSSKQEATTENGKNSISSSNTYIPDLITGDLDSLWDHVKEYYHNKDVQIIQDPDQDTNDLDKAIQAVMKRYNTLFVETLSKNPTDIKQSTTTISSEIKSKIDPSTSSSSSSSSSSTTSSSSFLPILRIIVYGAFGGRFDQEMASLQALYKWGKRSDDDESSSTTTENKIPPKQVVLYTDHTMAFLLQGGINIIHHLYLALPDKEILNNKNQQQDTLSKDTTTKQVVQRVYEGPTCGLIPLGQPVESITTTGLQWNLNNQPTSFGSLLSTSNRIIEPIVTVTTSHPIIFTTEILPGTF